jgi:hypothetical protein
MNLRQQREPKNSSTIIKSYADAAAGRRFAFAATLLLLGAAASARADGILLEGNHVSDAKTVLTLTRPQQKVIRKLSRKQPTRSITLSPEQTATLRLQTGATARHLSVWSLSYTQESCTCEASSVAVATEPGKIEVVHRLLGRDSAAESRRTHAYLELRQRQEHRALLLHWASWVSGAAGILVTLSLVLLAAQRVQRRDSTGSARARASRGTP